MITNALKDVKKRELLCTVGGNVNWYYHTENSTVIPQEIELVYDSAIPIPDIQPKETKVIVSKRYLYSDVHCSILKIAKIWKQPKCLLTDE